MTDVDLTCPFCRTKNDAMQQTGGAMDEPAADGDWSACFDCGNVACIVVQDGTPVRLRKPTDDEMSDPAYRYEYEQTGKRHRAAFAESHNVVEAAELLRTGT